MVFFVIGKKQINFSANIRDFCEQDKETVEMHHAQAVTVLEATHPDNIGDHKNSVTIKRHVYKDSNNNTPQVTKESLNAKTPATSVEEPEEYTLLGIFKFKSPIKWLNTISIVLIHLIFVYGFLTYPLKAKFLTTLWGKFRFAINAKFARKN